VHPGAMCSPTTCRTFAHRSRAAGIEGPWATVGVLSEKLPLRASSNGKAYSLWVLSDLSGALLEMECSHSSEWSAITHACHCLVCAWSHLFSWPPERIWRHSCWRLAQAAP